MPAGSGGWDNRMSAEEVWRRGPVWTTADGGRDEREAASSGPQQSWEQDWDIRFRGKEEAKIHS